MVNLVEAEQLGRAPIRALSVRWHREVLLVKALRSEVPEDLFEPVEALPLQGRF